MRRKISVLLAEDNMDHAELILEGLQEGNEQFIVQHVKDGETAILYLLGEEQYSDRSKFPFPDLVILDIKMPKKTGLEVLEVIKTTGALKKIPVLILPNGTEIFESLGFIIFDSHNLKITKLLNKLGN